LSRKQTLPLDQILHGDALEFMAGLPANSVDAIITDPPFFMPATHYQSRVSWQRNFADLSPLKVFWTEVTKAAKRVLKKTGHFIVFSNCDSYPVFYEPMYNHFHKLTSIVWNKKHVGLGAIWRHQHELIIAARGEEYKHNQTGRLYADVISIKATRSENRDHPVEKPWQLLRFLIEPTTLEGDVVLDPFCGSGTTLLAAKILKRHFIGVDLNEEYVKIAHRKVLGISNLDQFQEPRIPTLQELME